MLYEEQGECGQCCDYAMGWKFEVSWFGSRQDNSFSLFQSVDVCPGIHLNSSSMETGMLSRRYL